VRQSVPTLLTCFALLGCVSAADQQTKKMESALTPFVGKSVADYALAHGPPTNTIDMGANKKGFQWVITGQTAGAVVPLSGMLVTVPPRQQTCMVSLVANSTRPSQALSDWIIESWQWNGAC
jgi:hypothetical protein